MAADFGAQTQARTEQPDSADQVERLFATGERCRLVVENPRGRIDVRGWDRPEVAVRARKRAGGSSPARVQATRIEMHHQGDTVILRTVLDKQAMFGEGVLWQQLAAGGIRALEELLHNNVGPAEVEYAVSIPRTAELSLKGVSSAISVEGVRGAVRAATVSGRCTLARTGGALSLSTVSGAVAGEELDGRLEVKSVSGSIRLAGALSSLNATTVSGAIELAGPLASEGTCELHTVSGSATLRLPPDTGATIRAQGISMSVQSDLPVDVLANERRPAARRWEGRLGSGGASVVFQTVSGSLHLAALAGAAEAAPATAQHAEPRPAPAPPSAAEPPQPPLEAVAMVPPPPPAPPEHVTAAGEPAEAMAHMQILKALERGELTVDEALRRLNALRGSG